MLNSNPISFGAQRQFTHTRPRAHTVLAILTASIAIVAAMASHATEYYVATTGNDGNSGSVALPFRSITRCAQVAVAGDVCTLRAGVYRESVRPTNSGTPSAKITFRAYAREVVTVSGADPISGWTQHAGNVYKAAAALPITGHADTGFLANQVFVNGEMMNEARWPNVTNGSDGRDLMNPQFAGGGVSSPSGLDAVVSNASIPAIAENWAGATVWTSEWYTSRTGTITSVVPGSNGTALNATMSAEWSNGGFWFYLSNKLGLLDSPREWFYDGTMLYLWAPNGAIPSKVEAKQRNEAFDLSDRSHIVIRDIALFAATINTSNQSVGVVVDNIDARYVSHHATLPRPPISVWSGNVPSDGDLWLSSHAHDTGIQLRGDGHTLKNSRIGWSSGNGILLEGRNHVVSNNVIENTNYMVSYAAAVRINGNAHRIAYNTIRRTARDALIVDWHTTNYDFSDSEIAYNDISRFGMLSTDLGAIYICCYIDMRGTSIHHNHIREGYGFSPFWGTRAIYFDIESFNSTVHHNVVWALEYAADGASFLGSSQRGFHRIYNNTFLTNMFVDAGLEAKNNILKGDAMLATTNASNNLLSAIDPGFNDAANADFTLRADSPALDAGIPIAGITGAFQGSAPDIGAYERGGVRWQPGARPIVSATDVCPFDVDRSGSASAVSDGIALTRYVLGYADTTLAHVASDTAAASTVIRDAIERDRTRLDMDGNGSFDINDALIIVRHLRGMTDAALVNGVVLAGLRNTEAKLTAYIASGCPETQ